MVLGGANRSLAAKLAPETPPKKRLFEQASRTGTGFDPSRKTSHRQVSSEFKPSATVEISFSTFLALDNGLSVIAGESRRQGPRSFPPLRFFLGHFADRPPIMNFRAASSYYPRGMGLAITRSLDLCIPPFFFWWRQDSREALGAARFY